MVQAEGLPFGQRIEALRRRRGLSRRRLASLVGHSTEWLRQVERRDHRVDRLSTLMRLAEVLQVTDTAAFLGCAAGPPARTAGAAHHVSDLGRGLLSRYPPRPAYRPPFPAEQETALSDRLDLARGMWQQSATRYTSMRTQLPDLLDLLPDPSAYRNGPRAGATAVLCAEVYRLVTEYLMHIGDTTMALVSIDRALNRLEAAGDDVTVALRCRGCLGLLLLQRGSAETAHQVATTSVEGYGGLVDGAPPPDGLRSALVSAHLVAAEAAATLGDRPRAASLIDEARAVVDRIGTASGPSPEDALPTDVDLCEARTELVLGDPRRAVRLAEGIDGERLTTDRQVAYHLGLAGAHLADENPAAAGFSYLRIHQISPEEFRYNVEARRQLALATGSGSVTVARALATLAEQVGLF